MFRWVLRLLLLVVEVIVIVIVLREGNFDGSYALAHRE